MKLIQRPIAAIIIAVVSLCVAGKASAEIPIVDSGTTTALRTKAILTSSNVLSTTVSLAGKNNVMGVMLYIDFTVGSLTNTILTAAGAPALRSNGTHYPSGEFVKCAASNGQLTLTATGLYSWYIPREYFGSSNDIGVFCIGTGTATNSLLGIDYKLVYRSP